MVALILFVVIGGWVIKRNYELDNNQDRSTFTKIFGGWLSSLGGNLMGVTTYAIGLNWTPPKINETQEDG